MSSDACVFLMESEVYEGIYNIGVGEDITIRELADLVKKSVGFSGSVAFDSDKPDGSPRKLLDVSRMKKLGWKAKTPLSEGIAISYQDFLSKI